MRKLIKSVIFIGFIAILIYGGINGYDNLMCYLYPQKYSEYVERYAKEFDVPETLVFAVISCESSFDATAQSDAGAKGLMQMLDSAFDWAKSRYKGDKTDDIDIADEQTNIKYGTYILSLHYKDFGGWKETLAAYHAGAGNVKAWLNNPEYSTDRKTITKFPEKCSDTETYVNKVLKTQEIYKKLYYTE